MPRAWTATALEQRISLALLAGSLLKAIAAVCAPQANEPVGSPACVRRGAWRTISISTRGILRPYVKESHRETIEKIQKGFQSKDLRRRKAA